MSLLRRTYARTHLRLVRTETLNNADIVRTLGNEVAPFDDEPRERRTLREGLRAFAALLLCGIALGMAIQFLALFPSR